MSKGEKIVKAYKEYKDIYNKTILPSNRNEAVGFMKAVDFINIVYNLNLDLEGK